VSPAGEPLRYELHEQRLFDRPVLVIALEGWVDAGLGASTAIGSLLTEARPTRSPPSTATISWTSVPAAPWLASSMA